MTCKLVGLETSGNCVERVEEEIPDPVGEG